MSLPYLITGAVHPSAGESDDIRRQADAYASLLAYMHTFGGVTNMSNFPMRSIEILRSRMVKMRMVVELRSDS